MAFASFTVTVEVTNAPDPDTESYLFDRTVDLIEEAVEAGMEAARNRIAESGVIATVTVK